MLIPFSVPHAAIPAAHAVVGMVAAGILLTAGVGTMSLMRGLLGIALRGVRSGLKSLIRWRARHILSKRSDSWKYGAPSF